MLASLLPGLRETRTPLAVGYLWLLTGWLTFAGHLSLTTRPKEELLGNLFDLSVAIGRPASLAALTFAAYLVGSVLTFPVSRLPIAPLLLSRGFDPGSRGRVPWPRVSYGRLVRDAMRIENLIDRNLAGDVTRRDVRAALGPSSEDLGTLLLAANQEIYGEYDRAASEAEFRINLTAPLWFLGVVGSTQYNAVVFAVTSSVGVLLMVSGFGRARTSILILSRAVDAGVVVHPVTALRRSVEEAARPRLEEAGRVLVQSHVFNYFNDASTQAKSTRFEATLRVTNTSEGSVTIVSVAYHAFLIPGEETPEQRVFDMDPDETRTELAPGEHREMHVNVDFGRHQFGPGAEQIVLRSQLRFLDARGNLWLRDWDGVLSLASASM